MEKVNARNRKISLLTIAACICCILTFAYDTPLHASQKPGASQAEAALADSWITTKVRSSVLFINNFPGTTLEMTTKDGVVTISGTVQSDEQRRKIENAIRNIAGVKDVNNNLYVKVSS